MKLLACSLPVSIGKGARSDLLTPAVGEEGGGGREDGGLQRGNYQQIFKMTFKKFVGIPLWRPKVFKMACVVTFYHQMFWNKLG